MDFRLETQQVKLTKPQLKQIVKERLKSALVEQVPGEDMLQTVDRPGPTGETFKWLKDLFKSDEEQKPSYTDLVDPLGADWAQVRRLSSLRDSPEAHDWGQYSEKFKRLGMEPVGPVEKEFKDTSTGLFETEDEDVLKVKKGSWDSYTKEGGRYRVPWENLVGKEVYEQKILPQVQHLIKNVKMVVDPDDPANIFDAAGMFLKDPGLGQIWLRSAGTPYRRHRRKFVIEHELGHMISHHFRRDLVKFQQAKLLQLIDPAKVEKDKTVGPGGPDLAYIFNPEEMRANVYALRRLPRRHETGEIPKDIPFAPGAEPPFLPGDDPGRFTVDDVQDMCMRTDLYRKHGPSNLLKYLNCKDIEKTTNILNTIVKVDTLQGPRGRPRSLPQMQQGQVVATEQQKIKLTKPQLKQIVEERLKSVLEEAPEDVASQEHKKFVEEETAMAQKFKTRQGLLKKFPWLQGSGPRDRPWPRQVPKWPDPADPHRQKHLQSYTEPTGPNRLAWEKKIGKERYESEVLPHVTKTIQDTPVQYSKHLGPHTAGRYDPRFGHPQISFNIHPMDIGHWKKVTGERPPTESELYSHEGEHAVDYSFHPEIDPDAPDITGGKSLSAWQVEQIDSIIDPKYAGRISMADEYGREKSPDNPHRYRDYKFRPTEIRSRIMELRGRLGRQFTSDDVTNLCKGEFGANTQMHGVINCSENPDDMAIKLNSIVKVDVPQMRQRQAFTEQQKIKFTKTQLKQIIKERLETVTMSKTKAEQLLQHMREYTGNQKLTFDEAIKGVRWQFGNMRLDPVEGQIKFHMGPGESQSPTVPRADPMKQAIKSIKDTDLIKDLSTGLEEPADDDSSWHDLYIADMCARCPECCATLNDEDYEDEE